MIVGYYYLHENRELIFKKYDEGRVADFRDSDLVKAFWPMEEGSRESAWTLLVESLAAGALIERVEELAKKWKCDDLDAVVYATRIGCVLSKDGDQCCATRSDFVNLQENAAGFGSTCLEAMANLCKALGFKPMKLNWHADFQQLLK
jgi:hypothetical protein